MVEVSPCGRRTALAVEWMDRGGVFWSLPSVAYLSLEALRQAIASAVRSPESAQATRRCALLDPDRSSYGSLNTTARNQADARARARLLKARARLLKADAALKAAQASQDRAYARRIAAAGITYQDDIEAAPSLAAALSDE